MSERFAAVWAWIKSHKLISGAILLGFIIVLFLLSRRSGGEAMSADDGYTVSSGGYYVPGPSDSAVQASADLQIARYSADAGTAALNAQVAGAAHESDNALSARRAELQTGLLATLGGQQLVNAHDLGLATIDAGVSREAINANERARLAELATGERVNYDNTRPAEGFDVRRQQDYGAEMSYAYNYAIHSLARDTRAIELEHDENRYRSSTSLGVSIPGIGAVSFGRS